MKKTIVALLAVFAMGSALAQSHPSPKAHGENGAPVHKKPQPKHVQPHKKPHKRAHKAAHKPVHKPVAHKAAVKKTPPKHAVAQH